ncbi:hypothetical protein BDR07DRAFT_414820 [Suillus spraguei]|nr:hypothetical protein BDR07DRAFT_414820 [Suillus spraguei]
MVLTLGEGFESMDVSHVLKTVYNIPQPTNRAFGNSKYVCIPSTQTTVSSQQITQISLCLLSAVDFVFSSIAMGDNRCNNYRYVLPQQNSRPQLKRKISKGWIIFSKLSVSKWVLQRYC